MLDYRGLEALLTVQELQSFETAAKKLHITQSAVSQRIKALETYYGEPVLIRTLPYRPTVLGKRLLGHYRKVQLLEADLHGQIHTIKEASHISIAINRDSLETWFLELLDESAVINEIVLEIVADDQELTLEYLKNGRVSACVATSEKAIMGGSVQFLGDMDYLLVASPQFIERHFTGSDWKQSLQKATALKFDQKDKLHERYLERFFGLDGAYLNYHVVPSVRGFRQFALLGYGYGLIPRVDITKELEQGELVQLCPDKVWKIPLYWHYWEIENNRYQSFTSELVQRARKRLQIG